MNNKNETYSFEQLIEVLFDSAKSCINDVKQKLSTACVEYSKFLQKEDKLYEDLVSCNDQFNYIINVTNDAEKQFKNLKEFSIQNCSISRYADFVITYNNLIGDCHLITVAYNKLIEVTSK